MLLVTYGGHGGGKCAEQLGEVLDGGLRMRVVGKVGITLPGEFIRSPLRVSTLDTPEFLQQYEDDMKKSIDTLIQSLADGAAA